MERLRNDRADIGEPVELDIPDDGEHHCRKAEAWAASADFAGADPRGDRALRASVYLKRMAAEGHYVARTLQHVRGQLASTSDADWDALWDSAPVPDVEPDQTPLCCGFPEWGIVVPAASANGHQQAVPAIPAAPPVPDGMNIDSIYAQWLCESWLGPDFAYLRPYLEQRRAAEQAARDAAAAPPSLLAKMKTGAYLNGAVFPPLHYHIDGLVPEGLTVLSGAPKIGKSWLVLKWLLDLAKDEHFVLYLALEDSHRRMQWRCSKMLDGKPVPGTFCYLTEDGLVPGMLMGTIAQFVAGTGGAGRKPLIVVDTLAKALQQVPRIKDEAPYERDYRVTATLQALVRDCPGAGLVICHHDRKSGGEDWMDKASGTKGITGGPDAVMFLERGRSEAAGALHVSGKDIAENDYALMFRDGYRWEFDGRTLEAAAAAYLTRKASERLGDRSTSIVALAHGKGAKGIRRDEVAAAVPGMTPNQASEYLTRLYGSGRLRRGAARPIYVCVLCVLSARTLAGQRKLSGISRTQHTLPKRSVCSRRALASPPSRKNLSNTHNTHNPTSGPRPAPGRVACRRGKQRLLAPADPGKRGTDLPAAQPR